MIHKRLSIVLMISLLLIAGCSHSKTGEVTSDNSARAPIDAADSPAAHEYVAKDLNFEQIPGHIKDIYYADGNRIFIQSDKLYLYDMSTGEVISEASLDDYDLEAFWVVPNGYVMVGAKLGRGNSEGTLTVSDDGIIKYDAVFFDRKLNKVSGFSFNKLFEKNETMYFIKEISFSRNGNFVAYATDAGLYLYNYRTNNRTTVIDLKSKDVKSLSGVVGFEQIGLTDDDQKIAFKAQSFDVPPVPGKASFDTCGTVNTDGSGLSNKTFGSYTCKELTAYNKLLLFAEDFTIPSGRMMIAESPGSKTEIYTLTEKKESGNVSGSDSGRYFATTLSDKTGWKIRVYDTSTGKLEAEQRISSDGEALYMANDPIVKILDNTRTCIVLLGSKQSGIKTKVVIKQF